MRLLRLSILLAPLLAAACAARSQVQTTIDPGAEAAAVSSTALRSPIRAVFNWSLQDRDARFSGEGAARIEAPYKARLDLFGPRGEQYLRAALVDFDMRLPPGTPSNLLPPPTLLWSTIGVFRAPQNAQLVGAQTENGTTTLRYKAGDENWTFTLREGRLSSAEWQGPQQGRQTVEIKEYHARGIPARVVYRDWREFRELTLELNQVHDAQTFPADTWLPDVR